MSDVALRTLELAAAVGRLVPLFIDFETRSRVPIKHGGWRYAEDESTEVLCGVAVDARTEPAVVYAWSPHAAVSSERGSWHVDAQALAGLGFGPNALTYAPLLLGIETPPLPVLEAAEAGVPFVAHNAENFDAVVWEQMGLPPANWVDSLNLVRRRGLPGSLEKIGQQLYGAGKDKRGRRQMDLLCKPIRKTGEYLDPNPEMLRDLIRYCLVDVLLMAAVWYDEGLGDPHPDDDVIAAHRRINRRGLPVDIEAAAAIRRVEAEHADAMIAAAPVSADVLRSPAQLRPWLKERGVNVPDCTKVTLEPLLAHTDEEVRSAVAGRLAVATVTSGKAVAAQNAVCADGRLRGVLAYYGAATTGRWAGRLLQPHNLPKPPDDFPADIHDHPDDAPKIAAERGEDLRTVLGAMLRGIVVAPPGQVLGIADYSAIEARTLLWLADDWEGLRVYAEGRDPYVELASRLYNVPIEDVSKTQRQAGKVGVLSAGYQGGPGAVSRFARAAKIDLAAAGVEPADVVEAWRDLNPSIAGERSGRLWTTPEGRVVVLRDGGLWRGLKAAAQAVVSGSAVEETAGKCRWLMDGAHLVCVLPSGRPLVYRDAKYERVEAQWGGLVWSVTYQSTRGFRKPTFGGLWSENVAQAVSRDLLAAALVRLEAAGYEVLLHVHDEVVCGLRDASQLPDMMALMTQVPDWAAGFPLDADGHCAARYGKD